MNSADILAAILYTIVFFVTIVLFSVGFQHIPDGWGYSLAGSILAGLSLIALELARRPR